jgi:hypothetical protein
MNSTSTNVISFKVARIAKANGISYSDLINFLYKNRSLPEFQKVISKYKLEGYVKNEFRR